MLGAQGGCTWTAQGGAGNAEHGGGESEAFRALQGRVHQAWQSTRECASARGPRETLAPWRAAARPPLRARSGCSGAYGARHKWRQGAMAQLRQRRVERPARHCAARRQGQAFVQPHTLAWRSCGHHGLDNARPPGHRSPGPFACASPRRQVDEKAAAAAALGRGAAIFFSGSTHSHAWHRVAVPACPASGCRAAKGGREH